ncbi:MAG: hypothetical protein JXL97_04975 [Bacteroidales bacterium]|nr:hypothetical protein [Bacteroidales bacterium]
MAKEKTNLNSMVVGLIPGLIVPLLTSFLFYASQDMYGVQTYGGFLRYAISYGVVSQVLSVSLLGNLGVFFLFIWTNRNKSARGVILATFIYGLFILIYKFFL